MVLDGLVRPLVVYRLAWMIHVNTACQVPRRTGGES
jgi:hypothetical protein